MTSALLTLAFRNLIIAYRPEYGRLCGNGAMSEREAAPRQEFRMELHLRSGMASHGNLALGT
jgi:hypothetical protein